LFRDAGTSPTGAAVVFGTTSSGAWVRDAQGDVISVPFSGQLLDQEWGTALMILSESGGLYTLEAGPVTSTTSAQNAQYGATTWEGTGSAPHLGRNGDGLGTDAFEGELAEVLIYDHALAPADRTALLDYLNRKYFSHRGGTLIKVR